MKECNDIIASFPTGRLGTSPSDIDIIISKNTDKLQQLRMIKYMTDAGNGVKMVHDDESMTSRFCTIVHGSASFINTSCATLTTS